MNYIVTTTQFKEDNPHLAHLEGEELWNATEDAYYEVIDKDGISLGGSLSGNGYTKEEAERLVAKLNKTGEHKPYKIK